MRRPIVEPSIVPTGPLPSREQQEEWERRRRLEYIQRGLERGYLLLENPHDRRIFKTPKPIDNFLPIALKHLTVAELVEAVKPKYYGDIRYKPTGDYVPPKEEPEVTRYPEPAPSTAALAAADTSSEEKEEALSIRRGEDGINWSGSSHCQINIKRDRGGHCQGNAGG